MGEIILATVLMELGEAVVKELERNLGGLLALKEMLVELLTINDIDSAGLVGTDGDRSGIAIETVGIIAHEVTRSDALDGALATLVVTDKVMDAAALDVAKQTGSGSFGLKDVARRKVHRPTVVQPIFAIFRLQNNKKRRKKQLGEARKQVAEGATLKLVLEIQEIFSSVERLLSQKRDTGLILARRNVLK